MKPNPARSRPKKHELEQRKAMKNSSPNAQVIEQPPSSPTSFGAVAVWEIEESDSDVDSVDASRSIAGAVGGSSPSTLPTLPAPVVTGAQAKLILCTDTIC